MFAVRATRLGSSPIAGWQPALVPRPGSATLLQQLLFTAAAVSTARRSVAALAGRERDDALRGVASENRNEVARVLELTERALSNWETLHTAFLSPPVVADSLMVIERLADVAALPWGGFSSAERCRLAVGREEALAGLAPADGNPAGNAADLGSVAAVSVTGNFLFDPASHRDFLGACLGTGIERSVIGDVLVQGEAGAQILTTPGMVQHLEASLIQVRSVPVKTRAVDLFSLRVPAPKVIELSSVEASLRLDAVASAGFRMSRSKMADMIKGGDVRVNWRSGAKPSVDVAAGDVISVSGKGRLEVRAVTETKRGKYAVDMVRYV